MIGPLRRVLAALKPFGVRRCGSGWSARCPAHEDRHASLAIGEGADGRALLFCHGGCELPDVLRALGLTLRDLYAKPQGCADERTYYDYRDEHGVLLFQVVRIPIPSGKTFWQRRPDGCGGWIECVQGVRRVLYRLPELLSAAPACPVLIVEGEKDADNLARWGLVATTNPGGAGKWRPEYARFLRGRHVVILPDNDAPGRRHAAVLVHSLVPVAASIKVLELPGLPEKGDVSDWIAAGGTVTELSHLVSKASQIGKPRRGPHHDATSGAHTRAHARWAIAEGGGRPLAQGGSFSERTGCPRVQPRRPER